MDHEPVVVASVQGEFEEQQLRTFLDRKSAIYTKEKLIVPAPENGKITPQKVEPGMFDRSIPLMQDPVD